MTKIVFPLLIFVILQPRIVINDVTKINIEELTSGFDLNWIMAGRVALAVAVAVAVAVAEKVAGAGGWQERIGCDAV
ncbi:MAG: hypothetical protein U0T82_15050 [Bacteroidales bacterium]